MRVAVKLPAHPVALECQRLGLVAPLEAEQDLRQRPERHRHVRVVRAEHVAEARQRLANRRLRVLEAAFPPVAVAKIEQTDQRAWVALAERAPPDLERLLQDGLRVAGGQKLRGATINCYGDHRIAMAFAVAGLFASGETVIEDVDCIATSYPGFAGDLERICGEKSS